jgi:lycopene cyclase domain-containing protein
MTYLEFHLVFILPPLLVLAVLQRWFRSPEPWWPLGLLVVIAFVYTTPWDNYLVANEVWTYPPGAVLATIGYVPVEEYAFFGLQTVLTGLWLRLLQSRMPARDHEIPTRRPLRAAMTAVLLGCALAGAWMIWAGGHWTYMGLIVAWAFPILALMWGVGGHLIVARARILAWTVIPSTLWLWFADRVAIGLGIWDITDATRTQVDLIGLPIEEALFFLVTNLMVAQGLILLERPALDETVGRLAGRTQAA